MPLLYVPIFHSKEPENHLNLWQKITSDRMAARGMSARVMLFALPQLGKLWEAELKIT